MLREGLDSFARGIGQQVRSDLLSCLAFSTLLAWMFGLYWSNLFAPLIDTAALDFLQLRALWLASEAGALALFFGALMLGYRNNSTVLIVAGACTFVGTVGMVFVPASVEYDVWRIAGVVLTGVGSAVFLVRSGIRFARRGSAILLVNVAFSLLVATVLDCAVLLLPYGFQAMFVALLPILCVFLAVLAEVRNPFPEDCRLSIGWHVPKGTWALLTRVVALPLVVGLAYGLMQQLTADMYTLVSPELNGATVLSFFLSALIIGLAGLFFDSAKLIKLVCFVAIPIIGVAFVLLPLFSNGREAAQAICIVGFNSFYFMVWALWAGNQQGIALAQRFTLGLLVLVGAESIGSFAGVLVVDLVRESGNTLAVVSLFVVYLLLMAAIVSFARSVVRGPVMIRAEFGGEGDGDRVIHLNSRELVLDRWAERYGLSARETEVFDLLAKGRTRIFISKALFISDNTTRTHMKNIYRKLNVHSHQELIDLIEENNL